MDELGSDQDHPLPVTLYSLRLVIISKEAPSDLRLSFVHVDLHLQQQANKSAFGLERGIQI